MNQHPLSDSDAVDSFIKQQLDLVQIDENLSEQYWSEMKNELFPRYWYKSFVFRISLVIFSIAFLMFFPNRRIQPSIKEPFKNVPLIIEDKKANTTDSQYTIQATTEINIRNDKKLRIQKPSSRKKYPNASYTFTERHAPSSLKHTKVAFSNIDTLKPKIESSKTIELPLINNHDTIKKSRPNIIW